MLGVNSQMLYQTTLDSRPASLLCCQYHLWSVIDDMRNVCISDDLCHKIMNTIISFFQQLCTLVTFLETHYYFSCIFLVAVQKSVKKQLSVKFRVNSYMLVLVRSGEVVITVITFGGTALF